MCDCFLSSSPNWYCSKILDCDEKSGLFAFGSRNAVVLFHFTATNVSDSSKPVHFAEILRFHTDRVTGLAFSNVPVKVLVQEESPLYLASVGDDSTVNVVDVNTKTRSFHHEEHQAKISAVCWSSLNGMSKWVVSGDEKGVIVLFNVTTKKIKRYVPNKQGGFISVLASNPLSDRSHVVAVGYQGGLILILDLRNDSSILHRFTHHDGDVQSLCWAPNEGSYHFERSESSDATRRNGHSDNWREVDHLLASGSKDRTIKIWSMKEGVPMVTLHIPTNVGAGRRKTSDENVRSHSWITVLWRTFDNLLTNSHFGELLSWNLNDNGKQPWTVLGQKEAKGHSRTIFNIVNHSTIVCTVSLDRQVCFWDVGVKEGRCLFSMPTLGGYVYGLTFSPINSGYLAIGCGDSMIRTWNTTMTNNPYDVQKFWQGIKSKVTTLAWHPHKEGLLGFGTDEGRVGVYDVLTSKPPSLSMNFHRKVVYTVTWGPMCPLKDKERVFRLYSCGDGNILLHDPKEMAKPASNLNKLISLVNPSDTKPSSRSDISFNPDFSIMVVGNEDGNVELYETDKLKLRVVVCGLRKLIQSIRWHPKYTLSSTSDSTCSFWLAVASRDINVRVYDLREPLDNVEVVKLTVPSYELVGHSAAVAALAWNPHLDGQLASASFDGTVRIWNVFKMEVTACYCEHSGRVLCVVWDPINLDRIWSGGEDFTIRLWNVSDQEKEPKLQSLKDRSLRKGVRSKEVVVETNDVMDELAELLKQRKDDLSNERSTVPETVVTTNETKKANVVEESKSKTTKKFEVSSKKKKKTYKSMFPISNSKDNCGKTSLLKDCTLLADKLAGDVDKDVVQFGSGDFISLGAFGSRLDSYRLLKSEAENHSKSDNNDYAMHLEVWKGNVEGVLRNAAKKEQLSDWLVAMAPIVSPNFWKEMCGLYTKQLVTDGQPHKAVSYLLANQKVHEAIEVLKKHVSYREAIVLAKVRLTPSDPLIVELTEEWAERLTQDGNAEQAAKCYLGIGQSDKAATVLSQKSEPASLRVAAYVATKSGDLDSAFSYASRAAYESLVRRDNETFDQLIDEHLRLKPFVLVAASHKLLCESVAKDLVSIDSCEWRRPEKDLMMMMRDEWFKRCDSELDEEYFEQCFVCLTQDVFAPNNYKSPQILAFVAVKLSLALLYALKRQIVNSLKVIQSNLIVIQRNCDPNVIRWIFEFVLPFHDDMSRFFEHVDPHNRLEGSLELLNDNERRSFFSLCGSIEAYGVLTRLRVVLNEERQKESVSNEIEFPTNSEFESLVSSLEKMTVKLLNYDQAEHSRLRMRLEYVRMAIAALNAKQKWAPILGKTTDIVANTDNVSADLSLTLADEILDHSSVSLDQLDVEAHRVEEQLEEARKKLVVEQFPDPYDSCCLLAECCSLIAKRRTDQRITKLLKVVFEFGMKHAAINKQKTKLEQFFQGAKSIKDPITI